MSLSLKKGCVYKKKVCIRDAWTHLKSVYRNSIATLNFPTAKSYADVHDMSFMETSSKTNSNVTPSFETLASLLKQKVDLRSSLERQRGQTANLEDSVDRGNRRTTILGSPEDDKKEVNCCSLS